MNPLLKIMIKQLVKGSELKKGEIVSFKKLPNKVKASIIKDGKELRSSETSSSKNIEGLFKAFKADYFTLEITDKNLILNPEGQKQIIL